MSNRWNVIADPNVPPGMEAVYAQQAVAAAEARLKAEQDKRDAERQRQEQIRASLAQNEAERVKREEKQSEEKRKKDRAKFEADLREQFFARVPGATETDWILNERRIIAEAMAAAANGRSPVDLAKQRLLASGRYSGF